MKDKQRGSELVDWLQKDWAQMCFYWVLNWVWVWLYLGNLRLQVPVFHLEVTLFSKSRSQGSILRIKQSLQVFEPLQGSPQFWLFFSVPMKTKMGTKFHFKFSKCSFCSFLVQAWMKECTTLHFLWQLWVRSREDFSFMFISISHHSNNTWTKP